MLIYEAPQSQDTPCKDPFVTGVTLKNITLLLVCCRKALANNGTYPHTFIDNVFLPESWNLDDKTN